MSSREDAADILIVEDEEVNSRYLRSVVQASGWTVIGVVTQSAGILDAVRAHEPTVLLMDIHLERPHAGLEFVESGLVPDATSVVFVSGAVDDETLLRVQEVAPAGFVSKPFTESQVRAAVRVALGRGRGDAPGDLAQKLKRAQTALSRIAKEMEEVDHLIAHSSSRPPRRDLPEFESLSSREWEVLRRLMNHKRPPAIARELFISPHTVRNHLKSIYAKLNVHSQTELLDRVLGPMD